MSIIQRLSILLGRNITILIVVMTSLIYTLLSFGIYHARALNGDINNHILAADMFGVPADLKERGIKTLFHGKSDTGWDGQFYYYMSNDVLALKTETTTHIDSPSYRYQRIGLSLYAAIIAKILGKEWVSPTTFFVSYLVLILAATLAGAKLFLHLGLHPSLILLWSLSVGTQITLFNALPDAAADSFLILALSSLHAKKYVISVIPFVFAALSREVYVLFPSFILLFYLFKVFSEGKSLKEVGWILKLGRLLKWRSYYLLIIPGLVAVIWRIYITWHFGASPSSQATGILGFPLEAWMNYFLTGIKGIHSVAGSGNGAYAEAVSLFLFLAILTVVLWIVIIFFSKCYKSASPESQGLALTSFCLIFIYASFGPTVMMYYTGYFKAIAVFFFLVPLLIATTKIIWWKIIFIYSLLLTSLALTTIYNMKVRILPYFSHQDKYTKMSTVTERRRIACFNQYEANIQVKNIELIKRNFLSNIFSSQDQLLINLTLKNTGQYPFESSLNSGGVFMSYHWTNKMGKVVIDGARSAIPGILWPGQYADITVVSNFPNVHEDLQLKLSPVQENCAWFYINNPNIINGIEFHIIKN